MVREIDVLRSRKGCDVLSEKHSVAQKAGSFRVIELKNGSSIGAIINHQQFYQATYDLLSARLLTDKKEPSGGSQVLQLLKWSSYVA